MFRKLMFAAVAAACAMGAPAWATPVAWFLQNVTFSDGQTAKGFFIYDATTNTITYANIHTSAGAASAANYTQPNGTFPVSTDAVLLTANGAAPGAPVLNMNFTAAMTNGGGVLTLQTGGVNGEGTCNATACSFFNGGAPLRTITGGTITSTEPVPTLGEWAMAGLVLLLGGFGAFMLARRRRIA